MSLSEKLANLPIPYVLATIAVLLVLRYVLLKQKGPAAPTAKSVAEIAESLAVAMGLVFLIIKPFVVQAFFIPSPSMHPTLLEHDHILVNKFIYRFREPRPGDVVVFRAPKEATGGDEKDFIKRVIAVPGDKVRITAGYVLVGNDQYTHADLREELASASDDETSVKLVDGKVLVDGKPVKLSLIAEAVGKPGAKVKVVPGKVYINGKAIKEPYIAEDEDRPYPNPPLDRSEQWIVVDKHGQQVVKIPAGRLLVMGDNRNNSNDARFWGLLDRKRMLGKAMFIFWPLNRITWIH